MKLAYFYMDTLAPSFNIIPVIIALVNLKSVSKEGKVFLCYLIFNGIVSLASSVLVYHHLTNIPLFHITTAIETVLLLYFFRFIFTAKKNGTFLTILIFAFPIFCIANALYLQNIFTFNSYALSLQSFIIIALCFLYWWHHDNYKEKTWASYPANWIISGLMIYFSSAFILFTFSNQVISFFSKNVSTAVWSIHATLTIIMYILCSIGYSKYKKENG